ncbi:MAG: FkbM family methyltransferase [Anaerolineales bacterium]|nr:FkbM family methyltransferase [Anaerolineales bacterium]
MSNLKLAFKRMSLSSPYWDRSRILQTFKYFMAVESADARRSLLNSFRFKGINFELRPMEWSLMQAILLDEEYGGRVARLFEEKPPSVIIDAGANVGMFSVYALSKWSAAKVLAVEPAPDTFDLLERNQKKNSAFKWRVFQYAFWKEDGTVSFENGGLSMASHISADVKDEQIPSIRLDHFVEKYLQADEGVSLLKMDIEGAEEAVLNAAQGILARVYAIVIEIHSAMCDESAVRELLEREFDFVYDLSASSTPYPVLLACREAAR